MRGSRFCRGGPILLTFFFFFIVDEGIEDPNITNGPSSASQRKWRFAGGPMVAKH